MRYIVYRSVADCSVVCCSVERGGSGRIDEEAAGI